jgi:pyruvate dehydrogenase E2 component (dihydrolipoamide acetyltransferase)
VRKLATELGVDLTSIAGSGPGGRVVAEDVREAAAGGARRADADRRDQVDHAPPRPSPIAALPTTALSRELGQAVPGRMPIAGVRRVIAQTMTQSWTTIPHIHGHDELDAQPLVDAVRGLRRRAGERGSVLTLSVFFVLAAARALRRFPLVNASLDLNAHEIVVHEEVNVGLAVATPAGLMVPVVRHADRRSLGDLAAEIDRLARAARERKVKPEELRSGTFTVTNFGSLGGRFANPIIRPPEVGILGFGAIRERPWAVGGGRIEARPVLPISFGADHRLIDGDLSVAFQEYVRDLLSDPVHLLLGE